MSTEEPDDKTPEIPSTSETIASPEPEKAPESAPAPSAAETKAAPPAQRPDANRASLIAQLTAEKTKQTSAADSETESPHTDEVADDTAPDETTKVDEPEAKVEETDEKVPEPAKGDDEVFSEAELKGYKPRTAARIRSLLDERKQVAPIVEFGAAILTDIHGKVTPEEFTRWAKLGIEISTKQPGAADKLVRMAEHLGYRPAASPLDEEWLMDQVAAGEISVSGAKALRAKLKTEPVKAQPPERVNTPPPAQVPDARVEIDKATSQMKVVAEGYKTRHPADFDRLHKTAVDKLKEHAGTHPSAWPGLFKEIFERVIAEAKKPQTATKSPLRPGTTSSPAQPQFKSERERTINRFTK